jgi:hypothetical protein
VQQSMQNIRLHMKFLIGLLIACIVFASFELEAQEHGRVKWKSPTRAEADRLASESAMSDSILRNGDIVATDRGFFMFQSYSADGARVIDRHPTIFANRKAKPEEWEPLAGWFSPDGSRVGIKTQKIQWGPHRAGVKLGRS